MRFAGDHLSNSLDATPVKDKPLVKGFNTEDFQQAPQEVAIAPAIPVAIGLGTKAMKAYGAFRLGQAVFDGGSVNPGTRADYANQDPTTKYNRRKQNDYSGPASMSPYHQ